MGYRSDVSLTISKQHIKTLIMNAPSADVTDFLCEARYLEHTDDYASLIWDWVKWYEDYPEVAYIVDFVNKLAKTLTIMKMCGAGIGEFVKRLSL